MRFYWAFIFLLAFLGVEAQPLFTLTPDTVFATKPASNFTMYNYAQFDNLSGDTLAMRWVKTQTFIQQPGGHGGQGFGDWTISLQDPINFYNPAMELDSADFELLPITSSTDKFIVQLYPNGQEGTLSMTYKIFALNDPDNFVEVIFDYTVTPSTTSVGEVAAPERLEVFPNPANDLVQVRNNSGAAMPLRLLSANGQCLQTLVLAGMEAKILDISMQAPGLYFFVVQTNSTVSVSKFTIN